jgi:hypothetical protein
MQVLRQTVQTILAGVRAKAMHYDIKEQVLLDFVSVFVLLY